MNSLAIPMAHGHIALTVWATPRIAVLLEGAASARESARGGGPGVGPLWRVRRTEPRRSRGVAHLRLSALGPGRTMTASTVTSVRAVARRRTGCRAQTWREHQQHHRHHSKQGLCDGIRRK